MVDKEYKRRSEVSKISKIDLEKDYPTSNVNESIPEKTSSGPSKGLVFSIFFISSIIGLFFLSSNFTGSVIGLNQTTRNAFGIFLTIIGLVGGVFWFNKIK
jgi:hypothetical protein